MNKHCKFSGSAWIGLGLVSVLSFAGVYAEAANATGDVQGSSTRASSRTGTVRSVPTQRLSGHTLGANLDDRVKTLALALNLDAAQQVKLKSVLEFQRDQVRKVWDDSSVPAAYRVNATRTISDTTADRIRALLTEEQRKKYNQPHPPRQRAADGSRSVEDWMNATQPKPPAIPDKK
jgi:hypothetical protein